MRGAGAPDAAWWVPSSDKSCEQIPSVSLIVTQPAVNLPHPWFWGASSCWLIKMWEDDHSPPPTHNALLPFLIGLIILPTLGVTHSFWTPPHDHAHPLSIITSNTPHPPPPLSIQLPLMAALLLFRWLCATRYLACSMTRLLLLQLRHRQVGVFDGWQQST